MTVTELLLNFRQALLAIVPAAERVALPWRRPDAYDDWDEIASALYRALVIEVLRWSLDAKQQVSFELPEYDLLFERSEGMSLLEVRHPDLRPGPFFFHSFSTEHSPFDLVEVRETLGEGSGVTPVLETCPVEGALFQLRLFAAPPGREVIHIPT